MKKSLIFSFGLIGEIGIVVAIPLVVFGLLGRYLDNKYGTHPYLLLAGIIFATIIIYSYLKKIIKQAGEEFKKLDK